MPNGLPQVTLTFSAAVQTVANAITAGRLALVIRDTGATALTVLRFTNETEALSALVWSDDGQAAIKQAFLGHPAQLIIVALPAAGVLSTAYARLEALRFDVCTVVGMDATEAAAFVTWAKAAYDSKGKRALFVTGGDAAPNHKAIIHFATENIVVGEDTYSSFDYLPRIAGALAGLQLYESATYLVLPEVDDCPHLTRAEADIAIIAGKMILYHDGEKVKIARGVTSLTSDALEDQDFKKAKVIRILNQIESDIVPNIEDNYIGKVPNNYVSKSLLIAAINDYLVSLERLDVLIAGGNAVEIDVAKNRAYLKTVYPEAQVDGMDDDTVRESYTGDHLYLRGTVRPADSLENVTIDFALGSIQAVEAE